MTSSNGSSTSRRDVVLVFIAGMMLAFGVVTVVLAGRRAEAVDAAAIRLVSGCNSTVELPAQGRYLVSVEVVGPSVAATEACREVPAGSRNGMLASVKVMSPAGSTATLPMSNVNASRLVAGGQRGSLGVVAIDVAGEYAVDIIADGDVVVTIGSDPSRVRTAGWWWGVGWLLAALFAGLLVIRPRSRPARALPVVASWPSPQADDRLG